MSPVREIPRRLGRLVMFRGYDSMRGLFRLTGADIELAPVRRSRGGGVWIAAVPPGKVKNGTGRLTSTGPSGPSLREPCHRCAKYPDVSVGSLCSGAMTR